MHLLRIVGIWVLAFGVILSWGSGCAKDPGKVTSEQPKGDGGTGEFPQPSIELLSPTRAAMLTGSAAVKIEGKLNIPASRVNTLKVNGNVVKPNEDGSFATSMDSEWGVNTVSVEVLDVDGQVANRAHSYIWSKEYRRVDEDRSTNAAIARLGQKGIDDNNRSTLNDLASILEYILTDLDVDSLFPTLLAEGEFKIPPIGPTVQYTVNKTGKVKVGRRQVKIKARNDGLIIEILLKDVDIPIKGSAGKHLNKEANILAPEILLTADVDLRYANGQVVVDFTSINLDVSKVEVDAFSGIWSFLNGIVTKKVRTVLQEKLESTIKTMVPPLLTLFIKSFKFARDFTLPAFLGGATLRFDSVLEQLVFDEKGGTLGLSATITSATNIPDPKLGVPLRGQLTPKWTGAGDFAFGVALSYNIVNQILVATWQAGALKQDLSSLLGNIKLPIEVNDVKVTIDAKLPPVLHPGASKDTVAVGVGGLQVQLSFARADGSTTTLEGYVAARFGAKLGLSESNEISIQIEANPQQLSVDLVRVDGFGGSRPEELNDMIKSFVPKIVELLTSGVLAKFPIPSIDLGAIAGQFGIPTGTNLTIQNGQFSLLGDYIQVTGDL